MSEKEEKLESIKEKRIKLIKEINDLKYANIDISEKDKKANELYLNKIKPNFNFEEDFYYNLAMKYKKEIENNEFFKDLQYMPKGCLLHHHMNNCIDAQWISDEVMKEYNLKNIYLFIQQSQMKMINYLKI